MAVKKSFAVLLVVAAALVLIMVSPVRAGMIGSWPVLSLKNNTHLLLRTDPFYNTSMNGNFTIGQRFQGQWLWVEFHEVATPPGGVIGSWPIRLQHEINENYNLSFCFTAEMISGGVPVGNAYGFPEGQTPPQIEPPGGVIGTFPLADPRPTAIVIYAYASGPTEVGWGTFSLGVWTWPMYRHDRTNQAFSFSTAPDTNRTQWTRSMDVRMWGSPAVEYDKVYVVAREVGIYALNAFTGNSVWDYQTVGIVPSSPAVSNGRLYIGSGSDIDPKGRVYALNASTGDHVWNYTTDGPVASSPTVAYGNIYIGDNKGKIYALKDPGTLEWAHNTGTAIGLSSPAVAEGRVFIGNLDGKVYALNASTGDHMWNYTAGVGVIPSPAVADGKVYVGSADHNVYCLNASNGELVWNYTTDNSVSMSSPAVAYGKVYVGSYDDKIYCLDAETGTHVWNYTTSGNVYSSPAVADGKVYVGTSAEDDKIYALNASTGMLIWSYKTGGDTHRSNPIVAYGNIYVGTYNNNVYCFGPEHDIAIPVINISKTVVGQGYSMDINITVQNLGDVTERFNVQAYYNGLIGTYPVTLPPLTSTTVTVRWNTTGIDRGNYTIRAYASPVLGETDTEDNTCVGDWIIVAMVGDLTGPGGWPDGKCDIKDVAMVAKLFGICVLNPRYDPDCDLTGPTKGVPDCKIDIKDVATVAKHYGAVEQ